MPLNFPSTGLTAGVTTYTYSGNTWIWNGYAWDSVVTPDSVGLTAYVKSINGQTGALGLTGTANEIEVTGLTSFVVGLPDNVTISGTLNAGTIIPRASASELQIGDSTKPIRIGDFQNSNNGNYLSVDDTGDSIFFMSPHGDIKLTVPQGEIQLGDTNEGNASGALIDILTSPISQDNVIYIKPVQGGANYITINPSQLNYGTLTLTGQNAQIGSLTAGSIYASNIVSSWNGQTGAVGFSNYVASVNGRTGAFGLTGTANQISVTGLTSLVVGLPTNVSVSGNLTVGGNLTVSGGVTSTFSETVLIEDNFITLNSNVTGGSPSENAGIEISRGASANVQVRWNESTDRWQFTNDGSVYYDMPTSVVSTINGRTGAFGLTGTQYEIEITGATSFVVGLPDNVQIASSLSINGGTAWHSGNDGATSQLDAGYLYGIPGNIFSSNLSTGLLYGGIVSINAGNSGHFDITAGKAQIHFAGASFTAEPNPTLQFITWAGATGVTLSGLTSQDTTWLYFDSSGVLHQQATYYTDDQIENNIVIGALVHPSRSYISLARTIPNVAYATDKQYEQFIRAFGPMKVDGHTIQANGANLSLNRTSGTAFILGRNYRNDPNNPSIVSDNEKTQAQIWRYYRGATAGTFVTQTGLTGIDPANYDNGSGTLASVSPSTPFTIQRVFFYPNTPDVLGVYYGRSQYASLPEAAKNIHLEDFTEITNTKTNAVLAAFVIAKYNTTDLAADILADNARIIQAGQFRTTSSGGGSVATKLDDLTDVTITSVQDDDVLIYDTATSQWLNTPLAHIGVKSVNGLTGALTGIAITGSNTFTGLQTMNAGITASHLWVTNGATFAARSSFPAGLSSDNLYVSGGATFASLATFSSGLSSGGTVTVNSAIQVAQPTANTTALILRTRSTLSNYITINATGGNVTVAPGTGVLRVTQGYGSSGTITNSSRGYLTLQGTDGDASSWDVTIDPSTALTASRTLTCPNLSGTLAVVNAAQTFSSLQSFTAGITSDNLWVTNGATFAGRSSFTSGLTTSNLWVTNGATFANNIFAPNIVNSFNGATGTVTYAPTLASASATGVASFGNEFVVSAAGAVGLTSNYVKSVNGITGAVGITAGSNITITQSGLTFTISSSGGGGSSPLASASVTGVASFGNQFVVSALGAVSLTSNYVSSVNGLTGAVTISAGSGGMTSTVANTFSALQTFTAGITANALYVSGGATFGTDTSTNGTVFAKSLAPYGGFAAATLYINADGDGNGGGNTVTVIGDSAGEGNNTYIAVDDSSGAITLNGNNGVNTSSLYATDTVSGSVFRDTYSYRITHLTTTTTTTANQTIAEIANVYDDSTIPAVMNYPAFEVTISAFDTVLKKTEMLKMLVVQDGTNTVNTQYGLIRTGATGPVSSYSTTLSGSPKSLLIRATPLSANSTKFTTTVRAHNG